MKTISLEKAVELLKDATAVIVGPNKILLYPGLFPLTGEGDNKFLVIGYNGKNSYWKLVFREADNKEVVVKDNSLLLYEAAHEDKSEFTEIKILTVKEIVQYGNPELR